MWRKKLLKLVLLSIFILSFAFSIHPISEITDASEPCSWTTYGKDAGRTSHQFGERCSPETDDLVLRWKKQLSHKERFGNGGGVLVEGDRLYACTHIGTVYCLDTNDGAELWEYRGYRDIDVTPTLQNARLYCLTSNEENAEFGNVFCLDAQSGNVLWDTKLPNIAYITTTISVGYWKNNIYVFLEGSGNRVYSIDTKSGTINWSKHFPTETYLSFTEPVFYDDYMVVGIRSEDYGNVIKCFDLEKSGFVEWELEDQQSSYLTLVGSSLVVSAKDGITCYNIITKKVRWDIPEISSRGPVAHANGYLYFVNRKDEADYLTSIRLSKGKIAWEKKIPESEECCPNGKVTVAGGKIYTGNLSSTGLRAFSVLNGDILWEYKDLDVAYPNGGSTSGEYVVADGKLFKPYAGYVYCFSDPDPPIPTSIEVTPDKTHLLEPGESLQFIATIHDQYPELERIISEDDLDEKIVWSVTPTSLGTIDDNGFFTASQRNGGLGTITARLDTIGIEGTATLQIRSPQPAEIVCDPTEIVLEDIDPTANNPSVKVTLSNVGEMLTDVRLDCRDDWVFYPEGYKRIYPAQSIDIDIEFDLSKVDFSLVEDETLHSKIYVYWDKHERVISITIGLINIPEPEPEPAPNPEPTPDPDPEPNPEESKTITLIFKIDQKSYTLNDETVEIDSSPIIQNGRTLLPARYVTEPLGGDVGWESTEKKVVCTLGETTVEMWIGKPIAKVNGIEVQIDPDNQDVVPTIINDRTMVPMRFLAESLGCEVEWVSETKEIILKYN